MMRRLSSLLCSALLAVAWAPTVRAQQGPAPAPAAAVQPAGSAPGATATTEAPQARAPELVVFVDAGYPPLALAAKREAAVLMRLVVGLDGYVESAELVNDPVGDGFDELALAAARRFLFVPAMKDGVATRARVTYRYEFRRKAPPESAAPAHPAPPDNGDLEVTVRRAGGAEAVVSAEILLSAPHDPNFGLRLLTDAEGHAATGSLVAGTYEIRVGAPGLAPQVQRETIVAGEVTTVTYNLSVPTIEDEWSFGAVARVKAPPREVVRRTIEREELTRVAGTRGDALRTIELLPGVSRPPLGAGLILIRGSAPGDSQVFLEGMPVPLLYHFGGLTSFINSRALERIDFYPGNFSARYGRQIGGIIDVGLREPRSDGYHGVLDVNVPLDSSLVVEGPLGKKASFLVGGRRSYFGEVVRAVIPKGTFDAFAAPVYYDYQSFVAFRPTDRDKIKLGAYGSSDRLEILFADVPDSDPSIRSIQFGISFHRQQIGWEHQYSKDLDHRMTVGYGRIDQKFSLGPELDFDLAVNNIYARGEWRYRVTPAVQVIAGTDTFFDFFDVKYTGPPPQQPEGANNMNGALTLLGSTSIRDKRSRVLPAGYIELDLRPLEKLRILPGLRLDYMQDNATFAFDPRLVTLYSLTDTWRVKGGVGVFSQAPEPQESSPVLGNKNLRPTRSVHYDLGIEHDFTDALSMNVEGFYKQIYDRVVSGPAANRPGFSPDQPLFSNDGIGRIVGLEVAGRAKPTGRYFGFLSYTLMRSQRNDRGEGFRLFDFDQTHIFTLAGTVRLGRGWEAGATLRYVTGNPITPVVGHDRIDLVTALYVPRSGAINSARNPAFQRLDLRVEKTFRFDTFRLAAYLDVQNSYNATNRESTQYSSNFKQSGPVRGIPIIPILGLRGEL